MHLNRINGEYPLRGEPLRVASPGTPNSALHARIALADDSLRASRTPSPCLLYTGEPVAGHELRTFLQDDSLPFQSRPPSVRSIDLPQLPANFPGLDSEDGGFSRAASIVDAFAHAEHLPLPDSSAELSPAGSVCSEGDFPVEAHAPAFADAAQLQALHDVVMAAQFGYFQMAPEHWDAATQLLARALHHKPYPPAEFAPACFRLGELAPADAANISPRVATHLAQIFDKAIAHVFDPINTAHAIQVFHTAVAADVFRDPASIRSVLGQHIGLLDRTHDPDRRVQLGALLNNAMADGRTMMHAHPDAFAMVMTRLLADYSVPPASRAYLAHGIMQLIERNCIPAPSGLTDTASAALLHHRLERI